MPLIRSLVSKRRAYTVAVILLLSKKQHGDHALGNRGFLYR